LFPCLRETLRQAQTCPKESWRRQITQIYADQFCVNLRDLREKKLYSDKFMKLLNCMNLRKAFVLLLLLPCSFAIQAQSVDKLINKYVDFIGGKEQWKKVKTMVASGEYDYGGIQFPFTSYAKAPNRYKFVVPQNGKQYVQGSDGSSGWKMDGFKNETIPTLLTGKAALAMANEANVELEDAFIDYRNKGHQAVLLGKDTVKGKACFKVKLVRKSGDIETCYFDDQNFAMVMKKAVSKNVEMGGALLDIFYSDYRDIQGLRIPFKTVHESNGQMILTITIDKVMINEPIEDKDFQP